MTKLTAEAKIELVAEYRKGVKLEYLAFIFKIRPKYVSQVARNAGAPPRSAKSDQLRRMIARQDKVFLR